MGERLPVGGIAAAAVPAADGFAAGVAARSGCAAATGSAAIATCSAFEKSRPLWKRCAGDLASAFLSTASSSGPSARFSSEGGTGSSRSTLYMMVVVDSPVNGFSPVSSWYSTTPQENRSLRPSTGWLVNCSGDMYEGVPSTAPVCVSSDAPMRAMPKSATLTRPPASRIRLAGLMSRCTTPCACAWSSASRISPMMRATSGSGKRSPRSKQSRSSRPSTNSIAMYATRCAAGAAAAGASRVASSSLVSWATSSPYS